MGDYAFLSFVEQAGKTKTKVFEVRNKLCGDLLGYVKWYGPWRKYCYFAGSAGLVFDANCLGDIKDFIDKRMEERRNENRN